MAALELTHYVELHLQLIFFFFFSLNIKSKNPYAKVYQALPASLTSYLHSRCITVLTRKKYC